MPDQAAIDQMAKKEGRKRLNDEKTRARNDGIEAGGCPLNKFRSRPSVDDDTREVCATCTAIRLACVGISGPTGDAKKLSSL